MPSLSSIRSALRSPRRSDSGPGFLEPDHPATDTLKPGCPEPASSTAAPEMWTSAARAFLRSSRFLDAFAFFFFEYCDGGTQPGRVVGRRTGVNDERIGRVRV